MHDVMEVLARAFSRPDVVALAVLGALLLGGRLLSIALPGHSALQAFRPAPPMPHASRQVLRRASWRRTGILLLAAGLLLPPLAFLLAAFNPLEGGRLVLAVAVPLAFLAGAAVCFRKASAIR